MVFSPLVVAGPNEGTAKVQASFKDVKNNGNAAANDFDIVINKVLLPGDAEGLKAKGKKLKGGPKSTSDATAGTSTIQITKGQNGQDVEVGDKDTITIEFPCELNKLMVVKAYWTKDGKPIPGGEVPKKNLPGFKVVGDPVYTLINSSEDEPMGVRNLQFLVNVPEVPFDDLEPGTISGFGPTLPDFVLSPGSSMDFLLGDLDPGKFLYAQGDLFDAGFSELQGSFLHGHQAPVPEPSIASLLIAGTAYLFSHRWLRQK